MDEQQSQPFDHWCIVELMGHQRIAGRVTEVNLFGSALMRVDVPDFDGKPGFSKFYGAGAIYAVTPVDESVARELARAYDQRPVERWQLERLLPTPKAEPSPYAEDNPDWGMDDEDTEWTTEEEARDVGDLDGDDDQGIAGENSRRHNEVH